MEKSKGAKVSFIVTIVILAILSGTFIALYFVALNKNIQYGNSLENVYERSFYDVNNTIQGLEVKVHKASVSAEKTMQKQVLNEIWRDCNLAQAALSIMPLNSQTFETTIKFFNTLGGYSMSLSKKIDNGNALIKEDIDKLEELQKYCLSLKQAFNTAAQMMASGNYKVIENLELKDGMSGFESNFDELKNNESIPPELIYDGPFSESLSDKEIKGLPEETCTDVEATKFLEEFYKDEGIASVVFEGIVSSNFEAYNHTVNLKNGDKIYTQIAKRGMFMLELNRVNKNRMEANEEFEDEKFLMNAEAFVAKMGIKNMKSIFISRGEGLAYVNVAPIINKAVIYPDIIKIKLDEVTGEVVGYEAKSYAYNHVERILSTPKLSVISAQAKVSTRLTILQSRLSLIPKEYGSETLCYEFECEKGDYIFYVFINADTGVEEDIFRVVENTEGRLVV